jgi:hypothetical protein
MYGQSLTSLRCVDLATGAEAWRHDGTGYGGTLLVNGNLLVLCEQGLILLVKPDPTAYTELGRFQAVTGKCWNVPAISGGRIYVRSTTEGAAYDVTVPSTRSKLKLLPVIGPEGDFQLLLGTEDGSAIDPDRAVNLDVLASSDIASGTGIWVKLTSGLTLTNGQLRLDDTATRTTSRRFFQAQEPP